MRACCARCEGTLLRRSTPFRSGATTAAIALAALILYPFAVGLPMVSITKFGHEQESSILAGIGTLFGRGHIFIGLIVLVCSLVIPVLKLSGLLVLSVGGLGLGRLSQPPLPPQRSGLHDVTVHMSPSSVQVTLAQLPGLAPQLQSG